MKREGEEMSDSGRVKKVGVPKGSPRELFVNKMDRACRQ